VLDQSTKRESKANGVLDVRAGASAPLHESEHGAQAVHAVKLQSMGHGETTHAPASEVEPHGSPPLAAPSEIVRARMVAALPHETGHALQLQ
jgi:hypothetical protein